MSASAAIADLTAPAALAVCAHCGQPAPAGARFCCPGCAAARATIEGLGLGRYYESRVLDARQRALRPEGAERHDLARHIRTGEAGEHSLSLAVDGLQCGACVWLIESVLGREPLVTQGRVNMTTRHLRLAWRGQAEEAERLVGLVSALGYRLVPFDPACLAAARDHGGRTLLRALAVAGFAAGNVMMLSVAVWAGLLQDMGPATRALLYWLSALIALPAIAYAGRPFFASAFAALWRGRTNMDVPISIGVLLVAGISLSETMRGGPHAYFDSAVALLFFLLIGRVLDHRARAQARATAEQLLALRLTDVAVLGEGGRVTRCAAEAVPPGAAVLVGMGERLGVDGTVIAGEGPLDASLVTGESLPAAIAPGERVHAGSINLGAPVTIRATATGGATLLAECVRLIEAAEARRSRFTVFADRVARRYAPAVHIAALATFLLWWGVLGAPAAEALLTAAAVLIVTCPCALALAVPAVQVLATSALFRQGILLKSPTALERLAKVDTIVFDKTGTLTEPTPALLPDDARDAETLRLAASLAAASRHPLARALLAASGPAAPPDGIRELPGQGLVLSTPEGEIRLGSPAFTGLDPDAAPAPCLVLARPGRQPQIFAFAETPRADAADSIARLAAMGMRVELLSGDRAPAVAAIAERLGIADWRAGCTPLGKLAHIEALRDAGRQVLMVGDGLNDSPSLAAALVSMSPSSAADLSQTVADVVFQGALLAPVPRTLATARRAQSAMRENIGLSLAYNAVLVPLAVAGWVTPWLAAAAMSGSSLAVMLNSLRLRKAAR